MKKLIIFLSLLFAFGAMREGLADSLEYVINQGKVVARLGNIEIHKGYLELLQRVNPKLKAQSQNPAERKKLLENILQQELFYRESKKLGLDRQEAVTEKIGIYERVITAQALIDQEMQKKAPAYYRSNSSKFTGMSYEEAYPKIYETLKKETNDDLMKRLKGQATIEYLD